MRGLGSFQGAHLRLATLLKRRSASLLTEEATLATLATRPQQDCP